MSAELITFVIFDYLSRINRPTKNISIDSLLKDPGAPGSILKLTKQDLTDAIQSNSSENSFWLQDSSAGIQQLYWEGQPEIYAYRTLEKHYGKEPRKSIPTSELPADPSTQTEAA